MKIYNLKGLLASLFLLISANASAYDIEVDGIYYNVDVAALTAIVTSGTNEYKGTVNIPSMFEYRGRTFSVIAIGEAAFEGCERLSIVTIGENVNTIGEGAFAASGLTSIKIPDGICKIEANTFSGCAMLTSITIPSSVTELGYCSFSGCTKLSSLTLPNSIKKIGKSAFEDCLGLTSFEIPYGVEIIEPRTFRNCSNLKSVEIPNSVTSIRDDAFEHCRGLASLTLPNSVTWIKWQAFYGCTALTSLTISGGVEELGNEVFMNCTGLTDLIIEESDNDLKSDESTFKYCPIKNLYLGRRVYRVYSHNYTKYYAFDLFSELSTLKSVTIGQSDKMSFEAFEYPLENFTIADSEESLRTFPSYDRYEGYSLPSFFPQKMVENMYIGRNYVCSWINDYGREFSYENFKMADQVKHVILGGSCTSVGESQFSGIKELTTVTIGDSITEIKKLAFYGCSGLTSIYCTNPIPCEQDDTAFENMHYLTSTLYVPVGALDAYQNANVWKNFFDIQEFDPTGIEHVKTETSPSAIYTLGGQKVNKTQKGQMYIFRYGNGKAVKKLVK